MSERSSFPNAMESSMLESWRPVEGSLQLFTRTWEPPQIPIGSILISHGYAEHSGRYAQLAGDLCRLGYRVTAFDYPGHGRSQGRRAFVDSFELFTSYLGVIIRDERDRHEELPLVLFGHSLGGTIACLAALKEQEQLSGLILSSPAFGTGQSPWLQRFAHTLGRLIPRIPTLALDRKLLSHDPAYVAGAESDPLNFTGRMPARTGSQILHAMAEANERGPSLHLPVLLIHGSADLLTDPSATRMFYNRLQSQDKTLALFPNMFHETLNEPERGHVLDEITDWLSEHRDPHSTENIIPAVES